MVKSCLQMRSRRLPVPVVLLLAQALSSLGVAELRYSHPVQRMQATSYCTFLPVLLFALSPLPADFDIPVSAVSIVGSDLLVLESWWQTYFVAARSLS